MRADKAIHTIFKDNTALRRDPEALGSKEKWLWMRLAMGDIFRADNDIEEVDDARDTQGFPNDHPEAATDNAHRDFAIKTARFRHDFRELCHAWNEGVVGHFFFIREEIQVKGTQSRVIFGEMVEHFPRGCASECIELIDWENVFKPVCIEHHVPRLVVQWHRVDKGAITVKQDSAGCFHQWKC